MIKKLIALAATALFSLNASAGYVQYNISGTVYGYIIQNDQSDQIVSYSLNLSLPNAYPSRLGFSPEQRGEGSTQLMSTSTHFLDNGPTNFTLTSDFGYDQNTLFDLDFSKTNGGFSYTGKYFAFVYMRPASKTFSGVVSGSASLGTVDPLLAQYLEADHAGYGVSVPYIDPTKVPEPASLALFAVGALGAAGAARRRKKVA